jgi:DNA-binding LacI/PurR family transcriptional regulator
MSAVARSSNGGSTPLITDVAERAGVSTMTVSRVINGFSGVRPATRDRVQSAMAELGYYPNTAARALKRGEHRVLGLLVANFVNLASARLLDAVVRTASDALYSVVLLPVDTRNRERADAMIGQMIALSVDGLIVQMELPRETESPLNALLTLPTVFLNSSSADSEHVIVDADQELGMRQAVEHLLALGHRSICHISGPEDSSAATLRRAEWERTTTSAGAAVGPLAFGDWSTESGYTAARQLLDADPSLTAMCVSNDEMAIGALHALADAGLAVPDDVSVVGFDDVLDPLLSRPRLTTVRQEFGYIARTGVETLVAMIGGQPPEVRRVVVPTRLVVRDSTAAAHS